MIYVISSYNRPLKEPLRGFQELCLSILFTLLRTQLLPYSPGLIQSKSEYNDFSVMWDVGCVKDLLHQEKEKLNFKNACLKIYHSNAISL